jgi:hypothetical protein
MPGLAKKYAFVAIQATEIRGIRVNSDKIRIAANLGTPIFMWIEIRHEN